MSIIEIFAAIGALGTGYVCGQIIVWLWRGGLRLSSHASPEPVAAPAPALLTDDEFNTIHGWARLNPWYIEDGQLNMEAQVIHMGLQKREPHLSLQANLAEVTAEMHRRHPEIVPTRQ